ncbi:hypothetical protein C8F01DRAFT_1304315 [Mycena amicta]|nr:hypothetical protein C8F01DRAFT_1304315 [Mycena amicta]
MLDLFDGHHTSKPYSLFPRLTLLVALFSAEVPLCAIRNWGIPFKKLDETPSHNYPVSLGGRDITDSAFIASFCGPDYCVRLNPISLRIGKQIPLASMLILHPLFPQQLKTTLRGIVLERNIVPTFTVHKYKKSIFDSPKPAESPALDDAMAEDIPTTYTLPPPPDLAIDEIFGHWVSTAPLSTSTRSTSTSTLHVHEQEIAFQDGSQLTLTRNPSTQKISCPRCLEQASGTRQIHRHCWVECIGTTFQLSNFGLVINTYYRHLICLPCGGGLRLAHALEHISGSKHAKLAKPPLSIITSLTSEYNLVDPNIILLGRGPPAPLCIACSTICGRCDHSYENEATLARHSCKGTQEHPNYRSHVQRFLPGTNTPWVPVDISRRAPDSDSNLNKLLKVLDLGIPNYTKLILQNATCRGGILNLLLRYTNDDGIFASIALQSVVAQPWLWFPLRRPSAEVLEPALLLHPVETCEPVLEWLEQRLGLGEDRADKLLSVIRQLRQETADILTELKIGRPTEHLEDLLVLKNKPRRGPIIHTFVPPKSLDQILRPQTAVRFDIIAAVLCEVLAKRQGQDETINMLRRLLDGQHCDQNKKNKANVDHYELLISCLLK